MKSERITIEDLAYRYGIDDLDRYDLKFEDASKRIWCCECDVDMEYKGVAMDHPIDGERFICPKCGHRIVILKKYDGE